MWSELVTENKPQGPHTDFDPELVQRSNPKPLIGFTPIADEGMILLVWTHFPDPEEYLAPLKKKSKKSDKSEPEKSFEHHFLYIPKGVLLILHGDVVHAGGFCFGKSLDKTETNHHLHFFLCPNKECKDDVNKGQNHN